MITFKYDPLDILLMIIDHKNRENVTKYFC